MQIIDIDGKTVHIQEIEGICYVSPWSKFMLSKMPKNLDGMDICDYGAGTGILSIASYIKGAKNVTAIERESDFIDEMKINIAKNNTARHIKILTASKEITEEKCFDYIFCNPSCYPNIVGNGKYYNAGEFGIDMINEVVIFASRALKENGHLYILVPCMIPISLVFGKLESLGLVSSVVDCLTIAFRPHLSSVKQWVDKNAIRYPEMRYLEKDENIFEQVDLYDIYLKHS